MKKVIENVLVIICVLAVIGTVGYFARDRIIRSHIAPPEIEVDTETDFDYEPLQEVIAGYQAKITALSNYVDVRAHAQIEYYTLLASQLQTQIETVNDDAQEQIEFCQMRIGELQSDLEGLDAEMQSELAGFEIRLAFLQDYVDGEIDALMTFYNGKIAELRTHVDAEVQRLTQDYTTKIALLQSYVDTKYGAQQTQINNIQSELNGKVLYAHNLEMGFGNSTNFVTATVYTTSQTAFSKASFLAYLQNGGFTTIAKVYSISGAYSANSAISIVFVGCYAYTAGSEIMLVGVPTYGNQVIDVTYAVTVTDTVVKVL